MCTDRCTDMCMNMCIDMCIDRCLDMCMDICMDMCMDRCTDMCMDLCMDVCTDMCMVMCIDLCMDLCVDMRKDMWIGMWMGMWLDVCVGMSLSIRSRPFVLAAENLGQSPFRTLTKHLLPNLASYLLVAATLSIPGYILGEAALSFLGLGIQEPAASWGLMLKQAQGDMKVLMLGFWWLLTPGLMIFITVIAFNLLGDSLRDIVDPKMKSTR